MTTTTVAVPVEHAAAPTAPDALRRFREAYEHALPAMMALSAEELTPINVDISTAVATVLAVLPEIRAMRGQIAEELPRMDLAPLDALEGITLATAHAHSIYMAAAAPPATLAELNEAAAVLRDLVLGDAMALARRGLIDGKRLGEFKGMGYRQVAFDLLALANLLSERWEAIQGKTALEREELERAAQLAEQILTAVGSREQTPSASEAAQRRQRAFTLMVRAYDQVRRAVIFLRWNEGDADRIAPSLYAGRSSGRRKEESKPSVPAQPAGAPGPSASAPGGMTGLDTSQSAPGLPGSSPFLS